MAVARAHHAAAVLPDGTVLVVGGHSGAATAEVFDPRTASWSTIATLSATLQYAAAATLHDGRILIVPTSGDGVRSCFIFDPATRLFTPVANLPAPHFLAAVVSLPDGRVLVAGGSQTGAAAAPLVYDPTADTWAFTSGNAPTNLQLAATVLGDGAVVVAGGSVNGESVAGDEHSWLLDPTTLSWQAGPLMVAGRYSFTLTTLNDGSAVAVGGQGTLNRNATAERIEGPSPAAAGPGGWTQTGRMNAAHGAGVAVALPSGGALVGGGFTVGSDRSDSETYDPATQTWTSAGLLLNPHTQGASAVSTSGVVVTVGGSSQPTGAESWDPSSRTWTALPAMSAPRVAPILAPLPGNRVLVAGGYAGSGSTYTASAQIVDVSTRTWLAAPPMATARSNAGSAVLQDGRVVVVGGGNGSALSSAEVYDPAANTWTTTAPMTHPRSDEIVAVLNDGRVMAIGGFGTGATAEILNPAMLTWTATSPPQRGYSFSSAATLADGRVLTVSSSADTSNHVAAELYDPALDTWTAASMPATPRTFALERTLSDGRVLIAGGFDGGALTSAELYSPEAVTPIAQDDSYTTHDGVTFTAPAPGVLANDSSPSRRQLSAIMQSSPTHGTATLRADGAFDYVPQAGFVGTDVFTYVASDGARQSSPARVTITVLARQATHLLADPAILAVGPGVSIYFPQLTAHLSDASSRPIAGRTVTFLAPAGTVVCSAVTNSSGTAACSGSVAVLTSLSLGYTARFAGDAAYSPSQAHGTLLRLLSVGIL
jgi:N-acetylneuraminic acid mutarotase